MPEPAARQRTYEEREKPPEVLEMMSYDPWPRIHEYEQAFSRATETAQIRSQKHAAVKPETFTSAEEWRAAGDAAWAALMDAWREEHVANAVLSLGRLRMWDGKELPAFKTARKRLLEQLADERDAKG